MGVICGCSAQTEDTSSVETKKPSSIITTEPLPEVTEIASTSNNTVDFTSDDNPSLTMGQKNALRTAKDYLDYTAYSHDGLVKQLEFEKFSYEEAVYEADNCGANWNEQAALCAKSYLDYSSFSRAVLLEQLEFEGFTSSQAEYGANAVGYEEASSATINESLSDTTVISDDNSNLTLGQQNVLGTAESYLEYTAFSYDGLVKQLEFEGYSHEDAVYAAENCDTDWNKQAAICAQSYLDYSSFSRAGLIEQLEFEGFTTSQAEYGADAVGY